MREDSGAGVRLEATMANFISAEFGKADFVLLEEVSTEAFMENLKLRYMKGKIYSYIGEVVVSVNPYRNMVIYDKEYVDVSAPPMAVSVL